jgi:hypothetical protein
MLKKIKNILIKYINAIKFRIFENKINKKTWENHNNILEWAEDLVTQPFDELQIQIKKSDDLIVTKGYELRQKVLSEFKDKHSDEKIKIMINLPSKEFSSGGYSLFSNMAESFQFIGIETELLFVGENIKTKLEKFQPNIFLSSDHKSYTSQIDWNAVIEYKKTHDLKVGLTASLEEYGNSPLKNRLDWAKSIGIDFYYSFRSTEYFNSRIEYKPFFEYGYKIYSVEFGANPLLYFPLPNINKDLDYIFLASSNSDKRKRYFEWLPKILKNYFGFIDGPGWHKIEGFAPQPTHKFLYSRARIGINLHIDDSLEWASELNERTYILAACGIPQLVDNALLLPKRFTRESMFMATNPKDYERLFEYMLNNPKECEKRALKALEEVYGKHTTFHRASSFINQIKSKEND